MLDISCTHDIHEMVDYCIQYIRACSLFRLYKALSPCKQLRNCHYYFMSNYTSFLCDKLLTYVFYLVTVCVDGVQVADEFKTLTQELSITCIYGGAMYEPQG